MNAPVYVVTATITALCVSPLATVAQAPIPIREGTPGLLAQAKIVPAAARLAAFSEVPGAQMVAASIEQHDAELVYSFDFRYTDHAGTEYVEIDAMDGRTVCVEHCVEQDGEGKIIICAAPEIVALARARFVAARDTALAQVPDGHIVRSRLRVEQSQSVFVFDIEVGDGPVTKRVLIRASTGTVISVQPT